MKKYIYALLMCLSSISSYAQYITGSPPNIDWMHTNMWPSRPFLYTSTPSPFSIPDSSSGSDWFESVTLRYNHSNQPANYVCPGYTTESGLHNYTIDSLEAKAGCGYISEN